MRLYLATFEIFEKKFSIKIFKKWVVIMLQWQLFNYIWFLVDLLKTCLLQMLQVLRFQISPSGKGREMFKRCHSDYY